MLELGVPPLALQQAAQLMALHFRFTVTHTHTIAAHLYTLRCARRPSNAHLPQSIENRIEKAHRTLQLHSSSGYPRPPPIPPTVAQAKPANKGKSYTRYLKPLVSKEWIRLVRVQYANSPNPPSGTPTSRPHAHFLLHHLSFTSNLYKPSPYLRICREKNPMTLLRLRAQSHQQVPTHMLTIEYHKRDNYADRTCPHCPPATIGSEIHIILQCPTTAHIAKDIIEFLTQTLDDTGQPTWSSLNPTNKHP